MEMTEEKKSDFWYKDMRLFIFVFTELYILVSVAATLGIYGLVMVGVPWVLWTWELYGQYT